MSSGGCLKAGVVERKIGVPSKPTQGGVRKKGTVEEDGVHVKPFFLLSARKPPFALITTSKETRRFVLTVNVVIPWSSTWGVT
jgi:hypothetical protein